MTLDELVNAATTATPIPGPARKPSKAPLYPRLLRLRHIQPSAWQRAVFGEGAFLVAALLVMSDVASAWTLLAVPLAVGVVVKFHDLLVGVIRRGQPAGRTASQPTGQADPSAGQADPSSGPFASGRANGA